MTGRFVHITYVVTRFDGGGPAVVRRALGCGLVLVVARDGHDPTAARLALQIETQQNGIRLIFLARHAGAVRAVFCRQGWSYSNLFDFKSHLTMHL